MRQKAKQLQLNPSNQLPTSGLPLFFTLARSSQIILCERDTSIQYPYPIRALECSSNTVCAVSIGF